jgi:hypothetical protein
MDERSKAFSISILLRGLDEHIKIIIIELKKFLYNHFNEQMTGGNSIKSQFEMKIK